LEADAAETNKYDPSAGQRLKGPQIQVRKST